MTDKDQQEHNAEVLARLTKTWLKLKFGYLRIRLSTIFQYEKIDNFDNYSIIVTNNSGIEKVINYFSEEDRDVDFDLIQESFEEFDFRFI